MGPDRPDDRREPAGRFAPALGSVFVLALLVRLLHVWQIHAAPVFAMRLGDSAVYHAWAGEIAAGDWVGDGVFWYAPLYPYFLGTVYALFGDDGWSIRIVQAVLGSASCVLLADATRRWFSARAGIVAGIVLALYAPAVFYDGLVHKPVLELLLLSLVLWIMSTAVDRRPSGGTALALGTAAGLLALARENTLALVPVLAAWLVLENRTAAHSRLRPAALFALGVVLAWAPVALRNRIAVGEYQLTAANFGDNFYKGNNEHTDGTYVSLLPLRGSPEFERQDAVAIAERESGRSLSPAEVSRFWTARAFDYIRDHTVDWLGLMTRKLFLVWHATELGDSEDLYTYERWSRVLRLGRPIFHMGLLAPLAVVGLWVTWDRRGSLYPLYAMLALYPATVVLFYVFGRYRYPVVGLLVPFAAAGIAGALPWLRSAPRPRRVACLATFAAALAVTNWPTASETAVRAATLYNIGVWLGGQPERTDEAIAYYEEALALDPGSARTLYNLANVLRRRGDLAQAESRYRQALRSMPGLADAYNNLGQTVEEQGRADEALEYYRLALETDPGSHRALNNLGLALARRGRADEARRALSTAVQLRPDDAVLHYNLGNVLYQEGDPAAAAAHYRQAIALDPVQAPFHNNLGSALVATGHLDEAIDRFREALRLDPGSASAEQNLRSAIEQRAASGAARN
jgi:tetratricopeptide (TPR) repeat protein